ncbi:MAG: FAD-dependent oxidoreductase [bacterium]|nr:FAD-dependent oxidoreductase [bacterium]
MSEQEKAILVVGGGISGMTTALEAAEAGFKTVIVEKNPYLGGRVAQMNKYFPKLCPPTCGMEINFRRIRPNPNVRHYTLAQVENISGGDGDYKATIKVEPRYVNAKCTACGKCAEVCPVDRPNDFNYGMDSTKAAYLPHEMAFPLRYAIDMSVCKGTACAKCVEACQYDAIDLEMEAETVEVNAGAVVMATGWDPYDANQIDNLGFGKVRNVITNVMMERLAAPNGPTGAKIQRPSDGKAPESVAFVQCAGSRDENHLEHCSAICCLATFKHIAYLHEADAETQAYMFYIDLRAQGKYEQFVQDVSAQPNTTLIKGKVAEISEDPATGQVTVTAENALTGAKIHQTVDMVVLATGMDPAGRQSRLPVAMNQDVGGFIVANGSDTISTGVARKPTDVATCTQDATAAALKAIQSIVRR